MGHQPRKGIYGPGAYRAYHPAHPLEHFDQKTYCGNKTYIFNALTNISEVASAGKSKVDEIKKKQCLSGFNSIFAVASVPMAKLYYAEFKRQMNEDPKRQLKVSIIFSYGANEAETDGILDNETFHTNYDTSSDKSQNYYKDVSLRIKNRGIDLLIVVNMFLTGFDVATLNTLWVDKNLKCTALSRHFPARTAS